MSENADVPAVDLDRMTVQQLTALIAAAEDKRRDKLEDARDDKWPRKRHLSVSHGDISSGEAEGFQNYMGYKTTIDSNNTLSPSTVNGAQTSTTRMNEIISILILVIIMGIPATLIIAFAGGR